MPPPGMRVLYGLVKRCDPPERRHGLRISASFPVRIRGFSATGERLYCQTGLENLGTGGLYLLTETDIREWRRLMIVVCFSLAGGESTPSPVLAARVDILRVVSEQDRRIGFAFRFIRRRFA